MTQTPKPKTLAEVYAATPPGGVEHPAGFIPPGWESFAVSKRLEMLRQDDPRRVLLARRLVNKEPISDDDIRIIFS